MTPHEFTLFIYNLSLLPIIFFSVLFLFLTVMRLFIGNGKIEPYKKIGDLPFISVQIPAYNDPVAERCIKKCMEFDYLRGKYELIIADDSTNPETIALLSKFADKNPGFVKYVHRNNRGHFKPGALKNAMSVTKGELIVIFDADWIPAKDFLRTVIQPFSDPQVAIVQTRQGFYNQSTNMISRFASYLLMIYHTIVLPINNKLNCVFFCGTAGALRRSAFEEVGGWNTESVTEDSELSVKLLIKGYKSVYLDYETPSEVPDTFESFIKQQMRWCYGNARVFFDNALAILFKKGLNIKQRILIIFTTLSNSSTIFVVLMTFFGFAGWFLGELKLFTFSDFIQFWSKLFVTAGFIFAGLVTLYKRNRLNEAKYLILSVFTMGIVISVANAIAFTKAVFNKKLHWFCTPKAANSDIIKNDSS